MTTLRAVPDPVTPHRGGRWWRLAPIEARLLLRRRTTAFGVLSGPLVMIFFALVARPDSPQGWGVLAGLGAFVGMLIAVYTTAATVFTLRRESGALARLRTTELTGPGIVAGTGAPLLVIGVVQTVLICGVYVALGAPLPANPVLLLAALLLGGAFCVAAGALTSTFSRSAESVQFTASPLLLVGAVAVNVLGTGVDGPLRGILLLVPGTPVADLVGLAWAGGAVGGAADGAAVGGVPSWLFGLGVTVVWTAVAVLGTTARWRWTPRG
ncbi:ABC-2 type transport system permease protein [Pseudonocardia ammonioxydans]|uniref:ABC-2 type transport system permease protein n=1 Tax=Pseudonocardia ammonioxydans TaxID=260086 RepID=A0A1I5CM38_PSUAM|nr:ABC transporter permease [Pseudonocardia ammonioxydans]SFN87987.1 ABC-2 type transport system permease protein [Pseudonocardia ammonioxydans]